MAYHLTESGSGDGNKRNTQTSHYRSLPGSSINVHTSHDDALLRHAVFFDKGSNANAVRYVIVCRWLSEMKYYRVAPEDKPGLRFGIVDPKAFAKLDAHAHARQWWRSLGYQKEDLHWMKLKSEFNCLCWSPFVVKLL